MARIEGTKKYLLEKRAQLMRDLAQDGYNNADIGVIFNIDRSGVLRILSTKVSSKGGGSLVVKKS